MDVVSMIVGALIGAALLLAGLIGVAVWRAVKKENLKDKSVVKTVHPDGSETVETADRDRQTPDPESEEPGPNSVVNTEETVCAVLRQGKA